ncbi:GAF domain-containing protein [Salinadaptatus halalkaliphilus]|uniref:histidine kinase n=1 Tax=Salinadaptatus halalkaliphilus TaxID=2419781 RepID=A0A4S3TMZ6_9EURY|nr:GAF domain-containing sensor histidine kinase [Salinadaptatus halalkaliphilus]THE65649.1 GAF domain-containing protein [Salinadaptatus halalkaliphilus]
MTNENSQRQPETVDAIDEPHRRSFHVLYVDSGDDPKRLADESLPYPVTTAASFADARDALEHQPDCLVVAGDLTDEVGRSFLEFVRTEFDALPVVHFGSTRDVTVLERLVAMDTSAIVRRDSESATPTAAELDRLRQRLNEYYQQSISDVRETVLEIARSLMGAAPDEIDIEIEWGLKLIGRRLDADRCLVCTYEDGVLKRTHYWSENDIDPPTPDQVPASSFPGFDTAIRSYEPYAVPADPVTDLDIEIPDGFVGTLQRASDHHDPPDGTDRHPYIRDSRIESLLAVPIVVDWELEGVLAIEQETRRPWPHSVQQQVKTLGELVGHTLDRERRRQELSRQNDRLERFTSVVSHDLRNPLNVLTGYAELIEETGDPSHVEDVLASATRMETMIEDLLTLARNGTELDEREPIDLQELVTDAWAGVDTTGGKLETRSLPTIEGDSGRLQQVFENLFRNSIEHGADAHGSTRGNSQSDESASQDENDDGVVTVRVAGTPDGFVVEDDGPGIPPDDREMVFQEGYTDSDGTGLGLSIVDAIATAHGWTVTVDEGDLGGARFRFVTDDSGE